MQIQAYPLARLPALLARLNREGLHYGEQRTFQSLLTPTRTLLEPADQQALTQDLPLFWGWYHTWNQLYQAALRGDAPLWLRDYTDCGLHPQAIAAHRLVSAAGLQPQTCRVDYLSLDAARQIAEVQWTSGGLGFFAGLHQVLADTAHQARLGRADEDLAQAFAQRIIACKPTATQWTALGDVAPPARPGVFPYLPGELHLQRRYQALGIRYLPGTHSQVQSLSCRAQRVWVRADGQDYPLDWLYSQEFTRILAPELLPALARASLEQALWIETPLNWIYRQKWGMALPFMPAFWACFSDALRQRLVPSVLLNLGDYRPLVPFLQHPQRERLTQLHTLTELAALPASLRATLVIKCGGGSDDYYRKGQGVFRLTGSRHSAAKTLALVEQRMKTLDEPWLLQHYVRNTWPLTVVPPWALDAPQEIEAHARFMVYGGLTAAGGGELFAGLGNYASTWKVTGRTARLDSQGHLLGSAFNDISSRF